MQVTVTGIAWYRREDYDRLKEMFKDGDKLAATFDRWLAQAQSVHDRLTAGGHVVVKAEISPETFPKWRRAHSVEMDAKARLAYGNDCADEKYSKQQVQ